MRYFIPCGPGHGEGVVALMIVDNLDAVTVTPLKLGANKVDSPPKIATTPPAPAVKEAPQSFSRGFSR